MHVPVVDCLTSGISGHGNEIYAAITTVGCVYLKNIGFSNQEVSKIFKLGDLFFALPEEVKTRYARSKD